MPGDIINLKSQYSQQYLPYIFINRGNLQHRLRPSSRPSVKLSTYLSCAHTAARRGSFVRPHRASKYLSIFCTATVRLHFFIYILAPRLAYKVFRRPRPTYANQARTSKQRTELQNRLSPSSFLVINPLKNVQSCYLQ